jgi:hypothetical protein
VQSAAYSTNAAEWKMIARRHVDPAGVVSFVNDVSAIRARLRGVGAADPAAAPATSQISSLLGRHGGAAAVELAGLRQGDPATGVQILDRHAAAAISYSWMRPPSRSRRLTGRSSGVASP